MTNFPPLERPDSIAKAINSRYLSEEQALVRELADHARLPESATRNVGARALALVQAVRSARGSGGALDAFLREYSLASREGVILMCLAEALLRIPDGETADRLIADKIQSGAWDEHLGDFHILVMSRTARNGLAPQKLARLSAAVDTVLAAPIGVIERHGGGSVRCMLAEVFLP